MTPLFTLEEPEEIDLLPEYGPDLTEPQQAEPDEGEIMEWFEKKVIPALLSLNPRYERVLRQRFGINHKCKIPMTLEAIAKANGVYSRERVRQIESKALLQLRRKLKGQVPPE